MKKIFQPKHIFVVIIALAIVSAQFINARATGWDYVGSPLFSEGAVKYVSFALDNNNTPYVVFRDEAHLSNATVMKYTGSAWETVGTSGFSGGVVNDTAIAFDRNNTLYVGFKDAVNEATVMKRNGSNWEVVGTRYFSAGTISDVALAIGPTDDRPYFAYSDAANSSKATVMKFNGSAWENVGNAGFSMAAINTPSLAFDSNNTPYLAYQEGSSQDANSLKVTVQKFNGTAWELVGDRGFSSGRASNPSLALSSNDTPYIGFVDASVFGKATVMKFDSSSSDWIEVGSAGFSAAGVENTSLALDSDDTPYLAYTDFTHDENKATLMKYTDSNWEAVGVTSFTASEAYDGQLALSSNNTPYFAYMDTNGGTHSNAPTVMRYGGTANTPEMRITTAGTDGTRHIQSGDTINLGTVLKGRASQFTFKIENTGDADLNLTGNPKVSISGAQANAFTVASQPNSPVVPGTPASFIIEFDPADSTQHTVTINIANNDSDESPYTFDLQITSINLPETALFWCNGTNASIYVAERDGSGTAPLITALNEPHDIAVDTNKKKLYFTDTQAETIYRSNLNGTNQETVLSGLGEIYGIAVDPAGQFYWTDSTGSIWRANIDGSGSPTEIRNGLGEPHDLAIDTTNGKLYVTETGDGKISRSNLDGSSAEDLLTGLSEPYGIAVDPSGQKIYWTDYGEQAVQRANLDGTNTEAIVNNLQQPHDIIIDTSNAKLYFTDQQTARIYSSALDGTNFNDNGLYTANQEDNVYGVAIAEILDQTPPGVNSINLLNENPSTADEVQFKVIFDESVENVDLADFAITTTGDITNASVSNVAGSDDTYTVTVQTGKGSGDLRLDLINNDTIVDSYGNKLSADYTAGEAYTFNRPIDHDEFSKALAIPTPLPYNVTLKTDEGRTSAAANDPDLEECGVNASGDATIWYTYTTTSDTAITIDTFGSDYDTFIAVWLNNGTVENPQLNLVACNKNDKDAPEQLAIRLNSGTYYIEIGQP